MRGAHSVHDLTAHLVLVTKYRRRVITDRVRVHIVDETTDIATRRGADLLEADGLADHLHLLIRYPPTIALADLARAIKTNTSRVVRARQYPEVTRSLWGSQFWSDGYYVSSTGGAQLHTVTAYIRNQRT